MSSAAALDYRVQRAAKCILYREGRKKNLISTILKILSKRAQNSIANCNFFKVHNNYVMDSHCNYSHHAPKDLAMPLFTATIQQWTSTAPYTQGASSRSNLHAGCHWKEDNFAIYTLRLIIIRLKKWRKMRWKWHAANTYERSNMWNISSGQTYMLISGMTIQWIFRNRLCFFLTHCHIHLGISDMLVFHN